MLIVGAGGLALQLLDDLVEQFGRKLCFWTDRPLKSSLIEKEFKILRTDAEATEYFSSRNKSFIIAVGNPANRLALTRRFESLGGIPGKFISKKTVVSQFAEVAPGVLLLQGVIVEAGSIIGNGALVNTGAILTHEAMIGEYSEIGPGVTLAGNVKTGRQCLIGAGATIIPGIVLGDCVIVGAGSVVIRDVPDNEKVAGVPAKKI